MEGCVTLRQPQTRPSSARRDGARHSLSPTSTGPSRRGVCRDVGRDSGRGWHHGVGRGGHRGGGRRGHHGCACHDVDAAAGAVAPIAHRRMACDGTRMTLHCLVYTVFQSLQALRAQSPRTTDHGKHAPATSRKNQVNLSHFSSSAGRPALIIRSLSLLIHFIRHTAAKQN